MNGWLAVQAVGKMATSTLGPEIVVSIKLIVPTCLHEICKLFLLSVSLNGERTVN